MWIKGTDNVLGDAPSRNPADRDQCRTLRVPVGPVKRIVRMMFERPNELDQEMEHWIEHFEEQPKTKEEEKAAASKRMDAVTTNAVVAANAAAT